jgi:hypothetical protein
MFFQLQYSSDDFNTIEYFKGLSPNATTTPREEYSILFGPGIALDAFLPDNVKHNTTKRRLLSYGGVEDGKYIYTFDDLIHHIFKEEYVQYLLRERSCFFPSQTNKLYYSLGSALRESGGRTGIFIQDLESKEASIPQVYHYFETIEDLKETFFSNFRKKYISFETNIVARKDSLLAIFSVDK